MGKNKKSTKEYPMVSVCTPTFNRRPFIENMFSCFRNQDYPKHRIEWIIVDDGTDKIKDLIETCDIPQIRYFEVEKKLNLGAKRNLMHQYATGSIIVYMDDDDYYPPERISHSVEKLTQNPDALCAGSSEIYIYFKGMDKMIQCGPYGDKHATAGTFAFKKELLDQTKYEDNAALAEERAFLKDYTIPFVQLDPMKTILVFSHEHNTFDKRKMFDQQQDPKYFKESGKVVTNFIRRKSEKNIKKFFLEDIDNLLKFYEPGLPKMKPDVIVQMKEIEKKREQMIEEAIQKQKDNGPILLQQGEGKEPIHITNKQAVEIMKNQQEQIRKLMEHKNQNDKLNALLKEKVSEQMKIMKSLKDELANYKTEELVLDGKDKDKKVEIIENPPSFCKPTDGSELVNNAPINKSKPVVMVNVNAI